MEAGGTHVSREQLEHMAKERDLDGAGTALRAAEDHLKEGTGDPIERINVISIRSSLTTDLGYLEEAKAMLDPALRLAQKIRDRHLEGRLTFQQSSSIGYVDPALGLELAEKGLTLIDKEREPLLELVGRHSSPSGQTRPATPGRRRPSSIPTATSTRK